MEKDKTKKPVVAKSQNTKGSVREYLKGVRTETKKVVWPTRKELVSYTGVVILTCAVFSLGIWAVDSAFLVALKAVLNISF